MRLLDGHDESFNSRQRTPLYTHCLSDGQVWKRFVVVTGFQNGTEGVEFGFIDRNQSSTDGDDIPDTWNRDNRHPVQRVEPAEEITREKWKFHRLHPVGPTVSTTE